MRPRLGVGAPLTLCVLLGLLGLLAAGCGDGSSPGAPPPPTLSPPATSSPPPSPTPTRTPTETDKILAQYKAFWKALVPASLARPTDRKALLERYAIDPELTRVLEGMAAQDALGRQIYGYDILRPRLTQLMDDQAQVVDCQDSSRSGVKDRRTGRPLTVGVTRHPVITDMRRGGMDQAWRVLAVREPEGRC